jgi:phospholipase D1/2
MMQTFDWTFQGTNDNLRSAYDGNLCLYQDAHNPNGPSAYNDIYNSILNATNTILITGWSLNVHYKLRRKDTSLETNDCLSIGELLNRKAAEGVHVYVLLWDIWRNISRVSSVDIMDTKNKEALEYFKVQKLVNIRIWTVSSGDFDHRGLYSMHQKMVICDQGDQRPVVCYLGGLDLTSGRYDTSTHPLFATLNGCHYGDKHNPTYYHNQSNKVPREPWHDIHARVEGQVVVCFIDHFVKRWNDQRGTFLNESKHSLLHLHEFYKKGVVNYNSTILDAESLFRGANNTVQGGWKIQPFFSMHWGSFVDNSIQRAYLHAITLSKKFIYVETQFLIGGSLQWSCTSLRNEAINGVPIAIADRICKAIETPNDNFKAYIVIPLHPEGKGLPDQDDVVQKILFMQFQTISMIYRRIKEKLVEVNSTKHANDYLIICCLGAVEKNRYVVKRFGKNMIYVHSKMMIVDDEYILVGSNNLNERSLNGGRDAEVCIGAWQTVGNNVKQFRENLWQEHFNIIDDPTDINTIRKIITLTQQNRQSYLRLQPLHPHTQAMSCPFSVADDGTIESDILDDSEGFRIKFSGKRPDSLVAIYA